MRSFFARSLPSLLLLSPSGAQTTRYVSGGGNALDQAIAAAAPGDVLVVAPGVYFPFQLAKGLTIHAPARATLQGQYPSTPQSLSLTIPAGQEARISGFDFLLTSTPGFPGLRGSTVVGAGSRVAFEDCNLSGDFYSPALTLGPSSEVLLNRCGLGGTLLVTGATVVASDTTIRGGNAGIVFRFGPWVAREAVNLQGRFQGERVVAKGGDGVGAPLPGYGGATAIVVGGGSELWLDASQVNGGDGPGPAAGGTGILNASPRRVRLARTQVAGGTGTPPGVPITGPADLNAPSIGVTTSSPFPAVGAPFGITYSALPFDPIFLLVSRDLPVVSVPIVEQPIRGPGSPYYALLGVGVADAQGQLTFPLAIPADPALQYLSVWFHGIGGLSLPLQAAVPVGGVVR